MKKKDNNKKRPFAVIIGIIISMCSIATMIFAFANVAGITKIMNEETELTPQFRWYCAIVYFLMGLLHLPFFFQFKKKKGTFKHLIYVASYFSCGIIIVLLGGNIWFCAITGLIFFATLIAGRLISIFNNKTLRNIIINALAMFISGSLFVTCLSMLLAGNYLSPLLISQSAIGILSFVYILQEAFYKIQFNELKEIIQRTFVFEIILGLISLIVSFSFIFTLFEEITYPDALWYCFAVVTTIGFGDIVVTNVVCRILSVILGLYGILVVAAFTSVIVNFYNETKNKSSKEEKDTIL